MAGVFPGVCGQTIPVLLQKALMLLLDLFQCLLTVTFTRLPRGAERNSVRGVVVRRRVSAEEAGDDVVVRAPVLVRLRRQPGWVERELERRVRRWRRRKMITLLLLLLVVVMLLHGCGRGHHPLLMPLEGQYALDAQALVHHSECEGCVHFPNLTILLLDLRRSEIREKVLVDERATLIAYENQLNRF